MKNRIKFPEFTGVKCNMMPFIQGNSKSLPDKYKGYAHIIDNNYLEKGEIGLLTIDESFVEKGESQRGYNTIGDKRNVHIEVGRHRNRNHWGGNHWGSKVNVTLHDDTKVLIANNLSNTCRVWNNKEYSYTQDGDLSEYINRYPENTGRLLQAGEVSIISIFTPHECVEQKKSSNRQFFRIVGIGVNGRENYFTKNPKINYEV